jgi:thioredoxin-dependent peroxiredoxin
MRMFLGFLVATIAIGLSMLPSATFADQPKVGDAAPAFEMQGSDGKTYTSKDFIGKKAVIIAWFPKAFTPGCTKECKSLREQGEMLKKFDVAYFTASTDDVKKNSEFAKSLELDYPILCDPQGKNAAMFGVLKPTGLVADRISFIIGKDGKILAVDSKDNTDNHGKDLAEQLEKLGVAKKGS